MVKKRALRATKFRPPSLLTTSGVAVGVGSSGANIGWDVVFSLLCVCVGREIAHRQVPKFFEKKYISSIA